MPSEPIIVSPDLIDSNDPLESVIIAIPAFGKGVEHIYARRSKLPELLKVLNGGGFYRAVPVKLTKFFHLAAQSFGGSTVILQSTSSAGSHISQTSLTESQKDMYGIPQDHQWPLGSTTDLLFGR